MYADGLPTDVRLAAKTRSDRLPFVFEASGVETHFTNGFDPEPRARLLVNFPKPVTLARILRDVDMSPERPTWLAKVRHLPSLDTAGGLPKARRRIDLLERSALDTHFAKGKLVPLTDLVEGISAGKSFGTSNSPAGKDDWGIIKVNAMTWGRFKADENKAVSDDRVDPRFEIREGDLLVSRANTADYVGASVLVGPVRPKLLLSDKSLRLTPRAGVNPEWLWRALQAPSARRQITASATGMKDSMRNISQVALLQVLLPKVGEAIQALNAFAAVAISTNRLCTEIDSCRVRLGNLRRSLLVNAFSGRLTGGLPNLSSPQNKVGA